MSETFIPIEKLPKSIKKFIPILIAVLPLLFLSNIINFLSIPFDEFCFISDQISLLPVFYLVIILSLIITETSSFAFNFFVLKLNALEIIIFSSLQLVCFYAYFLGFDLESLRENISICFD